MEDMIFIIIILVGVGYVWDMYIIPKLFSFKKKIKNLF